MRVTSKMQQLDLRTTNLDAAQDLTHLLRQDAAAELAGEDAAVLGTYRTQVSRCHKLSSK